METRLGPGARYSSNGSSTFIQTQRMDDTKGLRGIRCKAKPAHFDAKQADLPVQEQGPVLWREIYQMEPKPQVTCGSPTALGAIYRFLSSVSRRLLTRPGGSGFFMAKHGLIMPIIV